MPSPIEVIINAGSGSVESDKTKERLEELFKENGLEANINLAKGGEEIISLAKKFAGGDTETIVVGGGDGTVSAVAAEATKSGKTLGVLPLGTLNNFSKDLQIPQNVEEAVRIIAENHTENVDIAEVNGRYFVNNSSIGLYPRIVKNRETQQRLGYGKWRAALWAALKILRQNSSLKVKLKTEEGERLIKTPFVFIGNNDYEMDFFNIGRRKSLTDGKLSVYFLHKGGRSGLFSLVVRTVFGRLRQANDFEEICTDSITIETRKTKMIVAFDGEIDVMDTPLEYRAHPHALRVIVPRGDAENS